MRYLLKIRRRDQHLLMTAYEKSGEPVCQGVIRQEVAPFLIRALLLEDAFDSTAGPGLPEDRDEPSAHHSVCYRNQNLYLAGVALGLEGDEHQKIADDLTRLIPQPRALLA